MGKYSQSMTEKSLRGHPFQEYLPPYPRFQGNDATAFANSYTPIHDPPVDELHQNAVALDRAFIMCVHEKTEVHLGMLHDYVVVVYEEEV